MKSIYSLLSILALVFGSVAGTSSCTRGDREFYVGHDGWSFCTCSGNLLTIDANNIPIEVTDVAADGSTVSFKVDQDFTDGVVSKFAVLFETSDHDSTCDVNSNAGIHWESQEYTAHCDATGYAEVKIFLYLCGKTPPTNCDYCETPGYKSDYMEYTFRLLCKPICTAGPTAGPTSAPTSAPTFGPTSAPTSGPTKAPSGSMGDPHFTTWMHEHYEYHGQCDMVLTKDPMFADGLGIDIQIRTKLVRYWSYIKSAAVRIGTDIFEVEGATDQNTHFWMNLEYKGPLTTVGGFPVRIADNDDGSKGIQRVTYEIDLNSKYPGQKIVIKTYKEFVKVDLKHANAKSFGNSVGMLGEFKTGHTLGRDGTVLNDFFDLGREWQVLPSEPMLFHSTEEPQFPQKCIEPEQARGQRRRLDESTVSEEAAEEACSRLRNDLDRKDCVYDILATQDLGMVGAF